MTRHTGWLANVPNQVLFLQWTEADGRLEGSLSWTQETVSGGYAATNTTNSSFTGLIGGDTITLTFPEGFGAVHSWTGAFDGDTLTITAPAIGSGLAVIAFRPASVADYNSAVLALQLDAASVQASFDAQASAAAEQAARDTAVRDADSTLQSAMSKLSDDLGWARGSADDATEQAASGTEALSTVRSSLREVKRKAAVTPMDYYAKFEVCYAVDDVDYQKDGVAYYTDQVRYDATSEASDGNTVKDDITAVHTAAASLEGAVAANPYGVSPATTPADGRAAAAAADERLGVIDQQLTDALSVAQAADDTAATLVGEAKDVARSVGAGC